MNPLSNELEELFLKEFVVEFSELTITALGDGKLNEVFEDTTLVEEEGDSETLLGLKI